MRTIEQNFLKGYTRGLNKYSKQYPNALDFVAHISELGDFSLQQKCREYDYAFLGELSRVISVILSIVEHPHITSSREEIIARIEQVKQLSNEDFTRSIRESSFWKKRGARMIPEKVYHYQQVDELIIYENKFICLLIDLLDSELAQYAELYLAMLPVLDSSNNLVNADKSLVDSMKRINLLRKRISVIKGTHFYKIIKKSRPISRNVQKTNILIHDNLYKQCYMFYCKFMVYKDNLAVQKDLRSYYLTIILKQFEDRGFVLSKDGQAKRKKRWDFTTSLFKITLVPMHTMCAFDLTINCKSAGRVSKHLLVISSSLKRDDILIPEGNWDSIDVLSLWNLVDYADNESNGLVSTYSEKQLISRWIDSKTTVVDLSHDVYTTYCPVCKSKISDDEKQEYLCPNCRSKYKFLQTKNKTFRIWFINHKRS